MKTTHSKNHFSTNSEDYSSNKQRNKKVILITAIAVAVIAVIALIFYACSQLSKSLSSVVAYLNEFRSLYGEINPKHDDKDAFLKVFDENKDDFDYIAELLYGNDMFKELMMGGGARHFHINNWILFDCDDISEYLTDEERTALREFIKECGIDDIRHDHPYDVVEFIIHIDNQKNTTNGASHSDSLYLYYFKSTDDEENLNTGVKYNGRYEQLKYFDYTKIDQNWYYVYESE